MNQLAPDKRMQAQTFQVPHTFTGGLDGGSPEAGMTINRAGSLHRYDLPGGNLL
jgi:hypothetical protein